MNPKKAQFSSKTNIFQKKTQGDRRVGCFLVTIGFPAWRAASAPVPCRPKGRRCDGFRLPWPKDLKMATFWTWQKSSMSIYCYAMLFEYLMKSYEIYSSWKKRFCRTEKTHQKCHLILGCKDLHGDKLHMKLASKQLQDFGERQKSHVLQVKVMQCLDHILGHKNFIDGWGGYPKKNTAKTSFRKGFLVVFYWLFIAKHVIYCNCKTLFYWFFIIVKHLFRFCLDKFVLQSSCMETWKPARRRNSAMSKAFSWPRFSLSALVKDWAKVWYCLSWKMLEKRVETCLRKTSWNHDFLLFKGHKFDSLEKNNMKLELKIRIIVGAWRVLVFSTHLSAIE